MVDKNKVDKYVREAAESRAETSSTYFLLDQILDLREEIKELKASHEREMLHYINEIDWLKQQIDEYEDMLFILRDCEPPQFQ